MLTRYSPLHFRNTPRVRRAEERVVTAHIAGTLPIAAFARTLYRRKFRRGWTKLPRVAVATRNG